ncbi:ABC transporter substrate-binding protein [Phytoactinopolyspora limicola]|uniref:ABC transporter substrate-binding protein n=1 Tax=Phytoactinopolyspora limicola TaxID=2715536 RepID=UPI00140AB3AE|nr:ABC transporter substrate-binding protein [Phytoactinopolyspora limicola]
MNGKVIRIAGGLGLAAALLVACSSGGAPPSGPPGGTTGGETDEAPQDQQFEVRLEDEEPAGEPQHGGRLDLMIRLDALELDPHKMNETSAFLINEQIYESLLHLYRGELQPGLAEEWEQSDDGMTLTFRLRDNAYFHSGRQVTADDVKYSLERIVDPDTLAPRARSYESIDSIDTPDESTVVLNLSRPDAALPTMLATAASSIVDRDVVEEEGGLNGSVDGGSGPFTLASRVAGEKITLDRADDYWEEGIPYLDGIDVTFNPDDNARAAAIRSGTIDFLVWAAPEFVDSLRQEDGLKMYTRSGALSLHLRMNTSKPPFDDERVRQAVFYALDRQELLDVANSGFGTVLNAGYLPPDRYGGLTEPIYGEPDLDRARQLLEEAGYPDGFEAELLVISTSAFQVRQAEVEQQQLAQIGIDLTIETAEIAVVNDRLAQDDFDLYQSGFSLTYDPDERFSASFTDGGGLNYSNWTDPEYEDLILQARSELDPDAREQLYREAETILAARGPVAMTFQNADFDVVQEDVMGYAGDPTPTYRFYKYLWLDR